MSPGALKRESLRERFLNNLNYKVLSLLVTLILWVAALGKKEFDQVFPVEIQPLIAQGMELVEFDPPTVEVRLFGRRKALMQLEDLHYTLNLSTHLAGTHIEALDMSYLPLPTGVEVRDNHPKIVKFTLK